MREKMVDWSIFLLLSLIWGSSFILMKEGMAHNGIPTLSAYQVAAIRLLSGGIVVLPFAIRAFKEIPKDKIWLMVISGLLGSFFPAFLFCLAETKIDSSLAGSLNALTPVFTILLGVVFFGSTVGTRKVIGVLIAFAGSILLLISKQQHWSDIDGSYIFYSFLVAIATIFYGLNVNVVSKNLKGVSSINIAAVAFSSLIIPSALVLFIAGFFQLPLEQEGYWWSIAASSVLGVFGTAVASILFYVLVKRAGGLFASMVTYGIPFVALFWGILAGEFITIQQALCLGVILVGVYLANK